MSISVTARNRSCALCLAETSSSLVADVVSGATIKAIGKQRSSTSLHWLYSLLVTDADRKTTSKGHMPQAATERKLRCATLKNLIMVYCFSWLPSHPSFESISRSSSSRPSVFRGRKKLLSHGWVLWLQQGGAGSMRQWTVFPRNKRTNCTRYYGYPLGPTPVSIGHRHYAFAWGWNALTAKEVVRLTVL